MDLKQETCRTRTLARFLIKKIRVCSGIPKIVKITNLQYLLRNSRLNCYDLLQDDRLTLRFSLDSVFKLSSNNHLPGVTIHYLLSFFGGSEVVASVIKY